MRQTMNNSSDKDANVNSLQIAAEADACLRAYPAKG